MKQYLDIAREVLSQGTRKVNRTGVDTISTFNMNYEIDISQGFPLLTTKEISWKNIVVENLWFLSGDVHIELLRKHGCRFWDPWVDENGRVPSAYGNFWRHFPVHSSDAHKNFAAKDGHESHGEHAQGFVDQVAWVCEELKRNPDSRRLVISAWAPGNAHNSALPPCHALWVLNVQRDADGNPKLNLHLTQRSCDVALGVPYNIAGYAFLLSLFSVFSGIPAGIFAHTLIDAHVYTAKPDGSMAEYDHVPGLQEQLTRQPKALPHLHIDPSISSLDDIGSLLQADTSELLSLFRLSEYHPHPAIKFKVAV